MPERSAPEPDARVLAARSGWRWRGSERPPFADQPGPGQESVWDYPRPPALRPEPRRVQVFAGDRCLADSTAAMRVLETASPPTVYLPPGDVDMPALLQAAPASLCEWKGVATPLLLDGREVGWCYPDPYAEFTAIAGWPCFYPGRVRCLLAGAAVQPQAGGYYGGWVSADLVGPWKGGPGSGSW